ncbi:DUF6624 domain-containing protein [Streptomyces cinerochromogenes]|uniref:DUF6624 domain-containing protein n=1 Tax=Streptomyces cinerochromogenes TaxID=66422 RepID=UPI0019842512|nr:DUF6624 domain-containing protein [Streptomyces cinerochromogenes]GGT05053.1 hypothetical protein GCM10010206_79200 [Streptomyces cinerochromogenes]
MQLPDIAAELLKRRTAEQEARQRAAKSAEHEDGLMVQTIDRDNTAWLKVVVGEYGWPGVDLVGEEGADAAWLIAQHADHDPWFQRRSLELITHAALAGQVPVTHYAYLTDRVRVAEARPQVYGTQYQDDGAGGVKPYLIEHPERLDARRQDLGLGPHAEYDRQMRPAAEPSK